MGDALAQTRGYEMLSGALLAGARRVTIAAPRGFGKRTLVNRVLAECPVGRYRVILNPDDEAPDHTIAIFDFEHHRDPGGSTSITAADLRWSDESCFALLLECGAGIDDAQRAIQLADGWPVLVLQLAQFARRGVLAAAVHDAGCSHFAVFRAWLSEHIDPNGEHAALARPLAALRTAAATLAETAAEPQVEADVVIDLGSGRVSELGCAVSLTRAQAALLLSLAAMKAGLLPKRANRDAATRVQIMRLRSRFSREIVRHTESGYEVAPSVRVELRAGGLRENPFLAEEWFAPIETALVQRAIGERLRLAELAWDARDHRALAEHAGEMSALDPHDERALEYMLRVWAMRGDQAGARAHFEAFAQRMRDDLGSRPSTPFETMWERVHAEV